MKVGIIQATSQKNKKGGNYVEYYLGKLVKVKMDRPLGSKHPKHNFIYSLNYGFIPNTTSGDGEEIDVYIIGEFEPLETYEGYVVAIIKRINDVEDKLVVCKELNKYNKEQIKALVEFQERFFESTIITY
ncbi:inorganic diphosphatase [Clostridium botulinum]|uniref:inorganic diphosphatase n=1 Tax=Clostridium botulinum TaxID=1491 RepID=UPI000A4F6965|nr:inorganic diphosphatase [Clostridium botulinum]